jgi:K+/H+ antiporter YhaU regulatory subunit KhtT
MPSRGHFVPNPPPATVVEAGATLIVFGDPGQVRALRELVGTPQGGAG